MVDVYVGGQLQSTNQIPVNGLFDIPVTLTAFNTSNTVLAVVRVSLEGLNWEAEQELTVFWHEPRATIKGRVSNPVGVALEGVKVTPIHEGIEGNPIYTLADGNYLLDNLPTGTYRLQFTKNGYVVETQTLITLASDEERERNVAMALRGDVNLDGFINAADIVPINRHALGIEAITDALNLLAADVNDDGFVNAADIVPVNRHALGIELIQ